MYSLQRQQFWKTLQESLDFSKHYMCILLLRFGSSKFESFVAAVYTAHEVGHKGVGHLTYQNGWCVAENLLVDLVWDELYYEYVIKVTALK